MAIPVSAAAKNQCITAGGESRSWCAENPVRVEEFLRVCLPDASRESIRRALAQGACRVDGVVRPMGFRLLPGQTVTLDATARIVEIPAEPAALTVLYEDDDLIAIDKPAGMLVHPAGGERTGTIANALRGMGHRDVHFLHRLDRGTSGVLLAAKRIEKRSALAKMFAARRVAKCYLVAVAGPVEWEEVTVRSPIGREQPRRPQWNVSVDGADAETRLRVRDRGPGGVLLEAVPVTGRTNQIRIHCSCLGHPVAGDASYGGPKDSRLLLHAWILEFPLGDGTPCRVMAPVPGEFQRFTETDYGDNIAMGGYWRV